MTAWPLSSGHLCVRPLSFSRLVSLPHPLSKARRLPIYIKGPTVSPTLRIITAVTCEPLNPSFFIALRDWHTGLRTRWVRRFLSYCTHVSVLFFIFSLSPSGPISVSVFTLYSLRKGCASAARETKTSKCDQSRIFGILLSLAVFLASRLFKYKIQIVHFDILDSPL